MVQSGGVHKVASTKLDARLRDIDLLDDAGNVRETVDMQVDFEGIVNGIRAFIESKSGKNIGGSADELQLETYAAAAKQFGGCVIWILRGTPSQPFLQKAIDFMNRYGVDIHVLDAESGVDYLPRSGVQ